MPSGGIKNLKGIAELRGTKRGVVHVYHQVTFGAAGAPTDEAGTGVDFARTAQGLYTVTFDHPYTSHLGFSNLPVEANADSWQWRVQTAYAVATKTVGLAFVDETGADQDPVSGDVYTFTFVMRTTTV